MSPGALLQNLRGRNAQGKQIATRPHQTLQKMTGRLSLHIGQTQHLHSEQLNPALSVHLTTLLPQKC